MSVVYLQVQAYDSVAELDYMNIDEGTPEERTRFYTKATALAAGRAANRHMACV